MLAFVPLKIVFTPLPPPPPSLPAAAAADSEKCFDPVSCPWLLIPLPVEEAAATAAAAAAGSVADETAMGAPGVVLPSRSRDWEAGGRGENEEEEEEEREAGGAKKKFGAPHSCASTSPASYLIRTMAQGCCGIVEASELPSQGCQAVCGGCLQRLRCKRANVVCRR